MASSTRASLCRAARNEAAGSLRYTISPRSSKITTPSAMAPSAHERRFSARAERARPIREPHSPRARWCRARRPARAGPGGRAGALASRTRAARPRSAASAGRPRDRAASVPTSAAPAGCEDHHGASHSLQPSGTRIPADRPGRPAALGERPCRPPGVLHQRSQQVADVDPGSTWMPPMADTATYPSFTSAVSQSGGSSTCDRAQLHLQPASALRRLHHRGTDGAERCERGGPGPGEPLGRQVGDVEVEHHTGAGLHQPAHRGRRHRRGRVPVAGAGCSVGRAGTSRLTARPRPPKLAAVSAAPTVPEWSTARPVLQPGLMPDTTRSGGAEAAQPGRQHAQAGRSVHGVGRDARRAPAARRGGRRCARRGGCGRWPPRSRSCRGRGRPPPRHDRPGPGPGRGRGGRARRPRRRWSRAPSSRQVCRRGPAAHRTSADR